MNPAASFMAWLFGREHTTRQVERLTPSEAIIISRSGNTQESWDRLTDQERADIRWNLGVGGSV